jgi:hypothetical protein
MTRRFGRWIFDNPRLARGRRRVIVLGDSHTRVFQRYVAPRVDAMLDVFVVEGATAQGLANPNSATDAIGIFRERVASASPSQTVFIQLGEVDCGFVIWYRAEKYGMSIDEQLELSLGNYLSFVDELTAAGFEVWVFSTPLPTIADDQDWGEVANLRRSVKANQVERTALTVRYNGLLGDECRARGLRFLDVTSDQLDPVTGCIKNKFMNSNPLDHHLDDSEWGELVIGAITAVEPDDGKPTIRRQASTGRLSGSVRRVLRFALGY